MNNASRVFLMSLRDDYGWNMDWFIMAKMEDGRSRLPVYMDEGGDDKHTTSSLTLLSGGLVQYGEDGEIFDYLLS